MARGLADQAPPLASHTTIPAGQAAALHRLINSQPHEHRATYRAALGLDDPADQHTAAT